MNKIFALGYACQIVGSGQSWQSIEDRLRAACASRFPEMVWDGMVLDAFGARQQPLFKRPGGGKLTCDILFRRGAVGAVVFASAYDAFKTVGDLELTLRIWSDRVAVVALDVDIGDPASVAEWGRRLHKLRADEAVAVSRRIGRPTGKPPLGFQWRWRRGRRCLVPNDAEQKMMRLAYEWFIEQRYSRTAVARCLMLSGYRSPRTGREWSASHCKRAAHAYAKLIRRGLVPSLAASA